MKKFVVMLGIAALTVISSGCVQINSSDAGSMNIHPTTIAPADNFRPQYEVGKNKVTAQSNVKCLFWIFVWGSDNAYADNAKTTKHPLGLLFPFLNAKQTAAQAAFYKACKISNCDAIIAARYEITFEDYFFYKKMNVEIKGFPAYLKSVEQVKPMPFYVDGTGKVVILDKMVKPVLLYDACNKNNASSMVVSKGLLQRIAEFLFGV